MDEVVVVVVDENDSVLNHMTRRQAHGQSLRHRIAVIWIENSQGQVLIAQRSLAKKSNPGLWGSAAAGTVIAGESYLQNAVREVYEELGLEAVDLVEVARLPVELKSNNFYMVMFKTKVDLPINKFIVDKSEVNAIKWVDKAQLFVDIATSPENYIEGAHYYEKFFA